MRVVIEGLGEDRALRTLVNGKVAASLGRLHVPATTARVQFANETGAKGGPVARCSITVDLPRRPELHADITAESFRNGAVSAHRLLAPKTSSSGHDRALCRLRGASETGV